MRTRWHWLGLGLLVFLGGCSDDGGDGDGACVVSGCPCAVDADCIDPLVCETAIGVCAAPVATQDAGSADVQDVDGDDVVDATADSTPEVDVPESATGQSVLEEVDTGLQNFCDRYEACGGERADCEEVLAGVLELAEGALVLEDGSDAESFAECAPGYLALVACINPVEDCPTLRATIDASFDPCPEEAAIFEGECGDLSGPEPVDPEEPEEGSGEGGGSGEGEGSSEGAQPGSGGGDDESGGA